jgi:ABC-2 type transport system ATP-binding protein
MIQALGLTKRFGRVVAVNNLSFQVPPGKVTGFLGPNGSGKSTTMRLLLGLDRADGGDSTINGKQYTELRQPVREVGALLDARYVHPTRSARNHLRAVAASNGIGSKRVDEVLDFVGLGAVARKRVGGFSLGMHQRLGLAGAVLGDPHTLLLDEPANGLDPEGIQWIRRFLKSYADQGRTVFVSSHLLSEMALMADNLVVIGRGSLISQGSVDEFVRKAAKSFVRVRSPQAPMLAELLRQEGADVTPTSDGAIEVVGTDAQAVGELAAGHNVVLHELSNQTASLEEAFLAVTRSAVEYGIAGDLPNFTLAPPPPPSEASTASGSVD